MISYRDMEERDLKDLWDISAAVWDYTRLFGISDRNIAYLASKQLALHYLSYSTYARTAVTEDGRCVGFLLASVKGEPFWGVRGIYMWEEAGCNRILLSDPKGIRAVEYRKDMFANCQTLKERHVSEFGSELILFFVHPDFQGRGIGRNLISEYRKMLSEKGITKAFLYTNGYCDRGFYESMGCRCIDCLATVAGGHPLEGFLYELSL